MAEMEAREMKINTIKRWQAKCEWCSFEQRHAQKRAAHQAAVEHLKKMHENPNEDSYHIVAITSMVIVGYGK